MVRKTLEVMPLAMHFRLSFTKALPFRRHRRQHHRAATLGPQITNKEGGLSESLAETQIPSRTETEDQATANTEDGVYLSVEFSSTVEEGLADFMHAVCVTGGVLQTGKGTATHLEGTVETACHICCGQEEARQEGTRSQVILHPSSSYLTPIQSA